jgi:hypothetical protein
VYIASVCVQFVFELFNVSAGLAFRDVESKLVLVIPRLVTEAVDYRPSLASRGFPRISFVDNFTGFGITDEVPTRS